MLPNYDAARSTPAPRNPFTLDTSEAQKYGASSLAEMAALLRKEAARIEQLSAVGFDAHTTAPTYSNGQDSRQFVVTSQQSLPPASSLIAAFTPEVPQMIHFLIMPHKKTHRVTQCYRIHDCALCATTIGIIPFSPFSQAVAKEVPSYTTPGFNSSLASGTLEAGNVAAARLAQLRGKRIAACTDMSVAMRMHMRLRVWHTACIVGKHSSRTLRSVPACREQGVRHAVGDAGTEPVQT